ncbi:MAG: hypothetical protein LBC82_08930 [Oscillospiraceae bacterium]|jgi:hypothetical protein|nr:hypothetical protein [Oscillospiraceae bacterium]
MKLKYNLFIAVALALMLILGGCAKPAVTDDVLQPEEPPATSGKPEEPPEQPDAPEEPPTDLSRLKPLELLGYFIDENGDVLINFPSDVSNKPFNGYYFGEFEPETFRKYFFGTWSYSLRLNNGVAEIIPLIVDDSELSNAFALLTGRVGRIGENVIATDFVNGGLHTIYWMDTNEPETLYSMQNLSYFDEGLYAGNIENSWIPDIGILSKTNAYINEPENNYLSRLRLYEIAKEYEIDRKMLTEIYYEAEDGQLFLIDDWFFANSIYLISEAPNNLVLKSKLRSYYDFVEIDVVYTIEKINGEWERTVEADNEQFEEYISSHERNLEQ